MAMERSLAPEILDNPAIPEALAERAHADMVRIHNWLGNTAEILRRLQSDGLPVRSVLDIGCGRGALLAEIARKLRVPVSGVDLRLPEIRNPAVPILQIDAVREPLPQADVAICLLVAHHLPEAELIQMIRNSGHSCRRLILLDLVRHWLPMTLFRTFVAPFVSEINARDGMQSIQRSYTPSELKRLVQTALSGTPGTFRQSVAPLYMRQIVDIRF